MAEMSISFSEGANRMCQVRLIFETLVDAVHDFKTFFEISGNQSFTAVFKPGEKMSLQLIPFFGGLGVSLTDLNYDKAEFDRFLTNKNCLKQFHLLFGFLQNNGFVHVDFEGNLYLMVEGVKIH